MSVSISRFLLPLGHRAQYTQSVGAIKTPRIAQVTPHTCRHASGSTSKPRVLEKPLKFNPPSHGRRLKKQLPRQYGPEITLAQKTEQQKKWYPNMMPPQGTFMYWFLTNRSIHLFISLGTLVILACITAFENWRLATVFREQLPAASDFLSHPIASVSQAIEVWKMDVARTSAETAEKRKRNVEDVQKRSTYRRAHGLEDGNSQGLGGWTARSNEDSLGPALKVDAAVGSPTGVEANYSSDDEPESEAGGGDPKEGPYSNYWEGRRRPVKKWLGIWT